MARNCMFFILYTTALFFVVDVLEVSDECLDKVLAKISAAAANPTFSRTVVKIAEKDAKIATFNEDLRCLISTTPKAGIQGATRWQEKNRVLHFQCSRSFCTTFHQSTCLLSLLIDGYMQGGMIFSAFFFSFTSEKDCSSN